MCKYSTNDTDNLLFNVTCLVHKWNTWVCNVCHMRGRAREHVHIHMHARNVHTHTHTHTHHKQEQESCLLGWYHCEQFNLGDQFFITQPKCLLTFEMTMNTSQITICNILTTCSVSINYSMLLSYITEITNSKFFPPLWLLFHSKLHTWQLEIRKTSLLKPQNCG
jgi:hypothetical protein